MKGSDRYHVGGVTCRLGDRQFEVVNLSVGGFFVSSDDPPVPGLSATFELVLPRRPSVKLVGRITWINQSNAPRRRDLPAGFGVKIERIAFPDKMGLLALLRESDPSALRRH